MNAATRSNAILILTILTVTFYGAAIFLGYAHAAESIVDHAWGAFDGVLGALLLILKADSDNHSAVAQNPTTHNPEPSPKENI